MPDHLNSHAMKTATENPPHIEKPEPSRSEPSRSDQGHVRRTLNVPFLIISLALFGLLAGILYGVRAWQVGRTAVALLVRADQLEKDGQWFDAAENIQRYVQLVPTADQERVRLAMVYEKGVKTPEQRERAIGLFYRAIGTGLEDQQVPLRRKVARSLLQNHRYFEARSESEKLLSQLPGDPEVLELRAKALWGQWQTKALAREGINREPKTIAEEGTNLVIVALEDAFETKGDDIELAVALAAAYRERDLKAFAKDDRPRGPGEEVSPRTEKQRALDADECLNTLVTKRPGDVQAYLARHHYRARWGDAQGAAADIDEALKLAPNNVDVLVAAAGAARQESQRLRKTEASQEEVVRQLERSRDLYQKCLNVVGADGDHPTARLSLGDVLLALGERTQAIELWEGWLAKHESETIAVEFQTRLAAVRLEEGDLEKAKVALDQIDSSVKDLPSYVPHEAALALQLDQDLRRGLLHIKRGEPKEAIQFLQRAIVRQEQLGGVSEQSFRALFLLGGAFAELGEWKQSADAYDRATLQEPNQPLAYVAASTSWLAANGIDTAIERAEQAVRLESKAGPTCRSWFALATALLRQQLLLAPADRVWARLDEAALAAQQRADDTTLADPWRIELLLADCALARGDESQTGEQRQDEALTLLRQAEAKYPDVHGLWEALPLAYQRLGATDDADRSCNQLANLEGGGEKAALMQVRLLSMRGDPKAAESALLEGIRTRRIDAAAAEQEMVNLKLAQNDLAGGREVLESLLKQSPNNLSVLRRLADIDFESRKLDEVQRWEEAMNRCGPAGEALSLYFKIRRTLLDAKSTKDAVFLSAVQDHARLLTLRPNWAEAVALGGLIEQGQGHSEQAIQAYQRAIALGEQRITIFERLIGLLESSNRSSEAARYLSRMQSSVSLSQGLTELESTLELRRNQIDEAINVARNGVLKRPQDASAHIWLGRMLMQKKLDQEAEQSFRQAVKLKPDDLSPWNALFSYCLQTGKKEEARDILKQIESQVKLKPADLSFVLGQCYELLGDRTEAAEAYAKSVTAAPKNPIVLLRLAAFYRGSDTEKSVEFARRALQADADSVVARRTLAAVLSDRGRDDDWLEVERLLSDGSSDIAAGTQDNRFRAILLTRRGGAKNLQKAADILEELTSRPESQTDADLFMLAQLYERQARLAESPAEAQAQLDKAYGQLSTLGDRATAQPLHLIALIEFSLRRRQPENAEKWLAKLAKLVDPMNNPAPGLLAEYIRLSLAQGNTQQAEESLKILETAQPDALSCITLRARLLEKQGRSDGLQAMIEDAAKRLLTKATRPDEKAAVLQGIGDLYASLKDLPQAQKWYSDLLKASPRQFDRLVMALTEQGEIGEALKVCRKQSEAKNVVPAAIVAVSVLASDKAVASETKEGEALIEIARKAQPDNLQLLSAVATLRVIQGQSDAAESLFAEMVQKSGRDPLALNNLATLLAEKDGKQDEALKLIDRALLIAGREPGLLDTKGTILLFKGDAAAAAANLEAAAREPDADPRYRFHLALAYRDLKRTDDAKSELERAIARDLEKQILTTNERKLLTELRSQLSL